MLFSAKVIPNRGAWLEFETNNKDQLWVKVDRKRKIAATTLLRAVGYETNDEIAALFSPVDIDPEHPFIANTLDKDVTRTPAEALIEVYKKLRPGDPPTGDNARQLVEGLFFNFRRYDLGRVGRYKFDKKLDGVAARMGIELDRESRGRSPARTSRRSSATSSSATAASTPRTTSTTSATAASGPTAS